MLPIDADVRETITQFVFLPSRPLHADYTIVLGMTLWQNPLAAAIQLVRDGRAGRLVFTGGYNQQTGRSEGESMAEAALVQGLSPEQVMFENRARHTGENLAFSWSLIAGQAGHVRVVNLVAISYHLTRALLTARKVIPESVALGYQSYESVHFSAVDWHLSERGRRDVLGELSKLKRYFPDALPDPLKELNLAS